jgi:hypothetical protein
MAFARSDLGRAPATALPLSLETTERLVPHLKQLMWKRSGSGKSQQSAAAMCGPSFAEPLSKRNLRHRRSWTDMSRMMLRGESQRPGGELFRHLDGVPSRAASPTSSALTAPLDRARMQRCRGLRDPVLANRSRRLEECCVSSKAAFSLPANCDLLGS